LFLGDVVVSRKFLQHRHNLGDNIYLIDNLSRVVRNLVLGFYAILDSFLKTIFFKVFFPVRHSFSDGGLFRKRSEAKVTGDGNFRYRPGSASYLYSPPFAKASGDCSLSFREGEQKSD
jgi:hypothetical protein